MCKGLPASGKTTWAKDSQSHPGILRVNKDDIRATFTEAWSNKQEDLVIETRDRLIVAGLKAGKTVISDDTNFAPKHERRLRQLAMEACAEFEVKEFNTPLEECIRRDNLREGKQRVGERVITQMWENNVKPPPPQVVVYAPDPTLPSVVICDLDGTLALADGKRGPYEHEKCARDKVNYPIRHLIWAMFSQGMGIVYMTGREETHRQPTLDFLTANHCPPGEVVMRPTRDNRKDAIVKAELFNEYVNGKYNVEFVLDDRDQVVKMWREMGLTCLQVDYGAF
jgi:predicted kinase